MLAALPVKFNYPMTSVALVELPDCSEDPVILTGHCDGKLRVWYYIDLNVIDTLAKNNHLISSVE